MGRVDNKIAIVSGGASGIGRGCAIRLAEEGARVAVTDVDEAGGAATAATINENGEAMFLRHDVTSEDAWRDVVAAVVERWGGVDILLNNAGIGVAGPVEQMTLEDWQRQQAINLDGVFLGTKHVIAPMRERGGGSIINISSVAGIQGAPGLAAYSATKGGVRLFTKSCALEFAEAGYGIRVNSVHPGVIDTPIWAKVAPGALPAQGQNDPGNAIDPADIAAGAVPGGQVGVPLDIANGVLFLASDESAYMTGSELVIDHGMTA